VVLRRDDYHHPYRLLKNTGDDGGGERQVENVSNDSTMTLEMRGAGRIIHISPFSSPPLPSNEW